MKPAEPFPWENAAPIIASMSPNLGRPTSLDADTLHEELDKIRQVTVLLHRAEESIIVELRRRGYSWTQIGAAIRADRHTARDRYRSIITAHDHGMTVREFVVSRRAARSAHTSEETP